VKLKDLNKLTHTPPKTGHYSEVVTDTEYEKGLAINFGINDAVCGSKRITMGRTIIPTHTANERHVHLNAEAAMFIVRGTMILLLGPEAKKVKCPPGTFVFAPEGVIHGVANPRRRDGIKKTEKAFADLPRGPSFLPGLSGERDEVFSDRDRLV
jgi:uncharacterized RmlC-like cupin family protein